MAVYEDYARDSRVRRHVRALARAGYRVRVFALGDETGQAVAAEDGAELRPIGTTKYRGNSRLAYLVAYAGFGLRLAVRIARSARRDCAAVWVNSPPDILVFAALPAKLRGIPVLLDIHDLTSDLFAVKFGDTGPVGRAAVFAIRVIESAAFRFASALITVHAPYRERISGRASSKPILDVLNVPDADDWLDIGDRRAAKAPTIGPLTIGHHGTIAYRFGTDIAIAAVARLRRGGMDASIRILGDGDFAPQVEAAVPGLGAAATFERRTFRAEELPEFVATIDVGVAPYRPSAFVDQLLPVKVLEYLALGVPVVATSTAVMRRYLDATVVHYVTEATDTAVADALRVLSDPAVRQAFAVAGRKRMRELGWPAQRDRLLVFVDEQAGPPGG
jgi:glycosyltransferase involved in cell wall biosynthesis